MTASACPTNAAERALRGIAVGRRSWLFAGSDRGGERAAAIYTLIATAKLNGVDPQAWLVDVLRRIAGHPVDNLPELLPRNWQPPGPQTPRQPPDLRRRGPRRMLTKGWSTRSNKGRER